MLSTKGMQFPLEVILICTRWYVAYPFSYRHLEEMMQERGVLVDHSTINRWGLTFERCNARPRLSAPWSWKTRLAKSIPRTAISMMDLRTQVVDRTHSFFEGKVSGPSQ